MPWGFAVPADWRRLNARIDQTQAQRNDGSGAPRRSTSHGLGVVLGIGAVIAASPGCGSAELRARSHSIRTIQGSSTGGVTVPQTPQGHPRIEEECVGPNESRQYDATAAAVVVGRIPM